MPTQYDPQILQDYADDLYKQAQKIIVWTAIKYGLLCFLGSMVFVNAFNLTQKGGMDSNMMVIVVGVVTVLGVLTGVGVGKQKAFQLKLEAQKLLCQRQIEQNTKTTDRAMAAAQR
jgi:hypothetical protein